MSTNPCPGEPQLRRWLAGDAELPDFTAIGEHVNDCEHCQARLDRLIGAEPLGKVPVPVMAAAEAGAEPESATWVEPARRTAHWPAGARAGGEEPPPDLPRYTGFELIDGGGMGVVFRAHDTKLNRTVAVKVMRRKMAADPDNRSRFRREAEAMAQLNHERIVRVYDIGEYDGGPDRVPYFAMEYVGGGTLARRIGRRPLPPREAAALAAQLAYGLDHAHQAGVIHRDLKPANVLLAEDARSTSGGSTRDGLRGSTGLAGSGSGHGGEATLSGAKISDFGLARQLDAAPGHTIPGAVLGTPSYMAPEQARGENDAVDARSDVYALGAVLYEMLTGRPPFEAPSAEQTRRLVAGDEDPPPVRTLQPGVAPDLETICMKCLQKDPARRYPTAEALGRDLDNWLAGRPIVARPVGRVERLLKRVRRNPVVSALVVLVVLTAAGGFAGVLWQLERVKDREAQVRSYAGEVERENEIALRNERQANANRDRANAHFRVASEAVHEFLLTELGQEQFEIGLVRGRVKTKPTSDPTRRALLQKAAGIYERLLTLGSDPSTGTGVDSAAWNQAQRTLATILDNLAIYQEAAGDLKEAAEGRERALRLREQLVAAQPKSPEFRHGLALSHLNLGIWHRKQGPTGHARAEELLTGAIAAADVLVAENPRVMDYLHLKSRGLANRAVLHDAMQRRDDATREFQQAAACLERLVAMAPDVFRYRHDRAAVLGELAGRAPQPEAEAALWRAVDAWQELSCDYPDEPDALDELTTRYYVLGAWYRDNGRPADQEQAWLMSARLSEGLVRGHPGVFGYAANLASVSYNLGVLALERREYEKVVALMERAIKILDGSPIPTHKDPTWFFRMSLVGHATALNELGRLDEALADWNRLLRIALPKELAMVRIGRAEALARKGNHVEAVTEAEATVAAGGTGEELVDAARVFAVAWAAAERDFARPERSREALAELYAARSAALLHRATDAGWFKNPEAVKGFREDKVFDPLRTRTDFRDFLKRLPGNDGPR